MIAIINMESTEEEPWHWKRTQFRKSSPDYIMNVWNKGWEHQMWTT